MKRITLYLLCLCMLVTVLISVISVYAKGPANMITIAGPELEEPLEITDQDILNRFDPWSGQFIGTSGALEWPPDMGLREPYLVFFHVEDNQGEMIPRYIFYYYPDPAGGLGTIYLPGSGEPYYRINVGTIIRDEVDGRWFKAMPTWDTTFQELMLAQGTSTATVLQHESVIWLLALSGVVILGVFIAWYVRRGVPARSLTTP